MVDIIGSGKTRKYFLAKGTPNEVWMELPEGEMIAGHKKWFGHILALNLAFVRQQAPHAAPLIPTIQAVFVLWQYVSFDIERLREHDARIDAENRRLQARLDAVEAKLAGLENVAPTSEPRLSTPEEP